MANPTVTDSDRLDRIARELVTIRTLVGEALAGMRKAEQEIPEFMRRFANYYHDIVHIKGEYVSLGLPSPKFIDQEMERCHDRMRAALDILHQDDEAFGKIRAEMAKDPLNRYNHTRQLTSPKETTTDDQARPSDYKPNGLDEGRT